MDARIAERRREIRSERRQRRWRRTRSALVALAVLAVLVALERSPLVAIEQVEVVGTERLAPEEVLEHAAVELGSSSVRLRPAEVEARVAALPLVRSASVRRLDPLTVRVEVVERAPVLRVEGRDAAVLLDRDGVVVDEAAGEDLPVVRIAETAPEPGSRVDVSPAAANAHAVWQGLSGPLRATVVTYEAAGPDELTLRLASGVQVRFGRAERLDEKVRALGAVLEDVGDTPVQGVDVRAPRAPAVVGP